MNLVTFHNRQRIWQEFKLKKGINKCVICGFQYGPGYTRSQNAFMLIKCQIHVAHRQCILASYGTEVVVNEINCGLCTKVARFDESDQRVKERRKARAQRQLYEDRYGRSSRTLRWITQTDMDRISAIVERTGTYRFK